MKRIRNIIVPFTFAACLAAPTLAQPANDDCAVSQAISGFGTIPWDTNGATTDGVDSAMCCSFSSCSIYNDVWFCWTATATGPVIAHTCGLSTLDTRLAVYAGCAPCPQTAAPVSCNDDTCGLQSAIAWSAIAGQQYAIRLGSYGMTDVGNGWLEIAPDLTSTPPVATCNAASPSSIRPGGHTVLTAAVTPGTSPASTGIGVTVDLSSIGGAAVAMLDDGVSPDAVAGDGTYSASATVGSGTIPGVKTLSVFVTDAESRTASCDFIFTVLAAGQCPCDVDYLHELEDCDPQDPRNFVNINGGCEPGSAVTPIACGQTVCGTAHTYELSGQALRDTDFYEITLAQCARVTWCVRAEFPAEISIIQPPCGQLMYRANALAPTCEERCVTSMLQPGTYWLFVAPQLGMSVPCGAEYKASVICDPCSDGPPVCERCCGKLPPFLVQAGFPEKVAVVTQQWDALHDRVLQCIGISNQFSAPLGVHWDAARFYVPSPDQAWSIDDLGTIFGVTLDDEGNIYVTHSSIYANLRNWGGVAPDCRGKRLSPPNSDPPGSIYKIDANTGVSSWLQALPNSLDTQLASQFSVTPAENERYPGLGNICFDCGTGMLYVSNFEDGRVYRLSKTGTILESYKHATGSVDGYPFANGATSDPDDPSPGWIPLEPHPATQLGQRVWAVQASQGRLYYSVWREDLDYFGDTGTNRPSPNYDFKNEIWSIALDPGTGAFVMGSGRIEKELPPNPDLVPVDETEVSNPVSDISFTDECCMLLAERTMQDDTTSGAHRSRLLEYCAIENAWTDSGHVFHPGVATYPDSSAGGVGFDFQRSRDTRVNVWATADFMAGRPHLAYGIIGMRSAGGAAASSLMVDSDDDDGEQDKTQQGDVEITCPPCMTIEDVRVSCGPAGDEHTLVYTFTITNHSDLDAGAVRFEVIGTPGLSFPAPTITVRVLAGETETVTTTIIRTNADPQDLFIPCFRITLLDVEGAPICSITHCLLLGPDCSCGQATHEVWCTQDLGGMSFRLRLNLENLSPATVRRVTLAPWPAPAVHFSPSSFIVTLSPFGGSATISTTLTGAHGGDDICVVVTLHDSATGGAVICSFMYCLTLPNCDFDIFDGGIGPVDANFNVGDVINLDGWVHGCVTEAPLFQWRRNELDLADDGRITGTNTPTLRIAAAELADGATYDLVATTAFQTLIVGPASVSVVSPPCPADVNLDRVVDLSDLTILLGNFGADNGPSGVLGDVTLDGAVTLEDLTILLSAFGSSCQ